MSNVQWAGMVALLIVCGAVLWVYMGIDEPTEDLYERRMASERMLEAHAEVLRAYREANEGAWPEDLVAARTFAKEHPGLPRLGIGAKAVPNSVAGVGFYEYRPPAPGDPEDVVVMAASKPHRAVLLGDRYHGETATRSLPPLHLALDRELQVVRLSPEEQLRRAPWLSAEDDAADSPEEAP